jgi:hyaluronoglucosaminidase
VPVELSENLSLPIVVDNDTVDAAIEIRQNQETGASSTSGGAVRIVNTGNPGIGLLVYSANPDPTGRLLVVNAAHAAFDTSAVRIEHAGTGRGLDINHTGTGIGANIAAAGGATASSHALAVSLSGTGSASSSAGSFLSANEAHSALQVTGVETGRGTIKVSHTGDGDDGNASGLSIDLAGAGTAAQGIFVDSSGATTGRLLTLRNNAQARFYVEADGSLTMLGTTRIVTGAGAPEGSVTAPVGSLYLRTDGGASTTLYVKTSGSGNTGWTAK